jgi:hypothetical protein
MSVGESCANLLGCRLCCCDGDCDAAAVGGASDCENGEVIVAEYERDGAPGGECVKLGVGVSVDAVVGVDVGVGTWLLVCAGEVVRVDEVDDVLVLVALIEAVPDIELVVEGVLDGDLVKLGA